MLDRFLEQVIELMEHYDFLIKHEKKKIKEVNKTIRQLSKINEMVETKVDIAPHIKERDQHLKNLVELKQEAKKVNKIYKILMKSE